MVSIETGSRPAVDTPDEAVRIQKSISVLCLVNLVRGIGLVTDTGCLGAARSASRPRTAPCDLRKPSAERIARNYWSPDDRRVIEPQASGLGWDVNVGRLWRATTR